LWIAYSGGVDSHVLLHVAARLRERLDLDLAAVHAHHGLQPAADDWVIHCRQVCDELRVPLSIHYLNLSPSAGDSVEAVAREARLAIFRSLLGPGDILATAHHRDDQAETLLLALLRGAGVHGLAGMPAQAPLGDGLLLRPLLDLPRAALLDYARAQGLHWIEDPTNADPTLDRNRLRTTTLPSLRERWPSLDLTLARAAAHCAEAATLLDSLADDLLDRVRLGDSPALSIDRLRGLDDARRRLVLRRWMARQGHRAPDVARLARISDELLPAAPDRQPVVAWAGCEVRRYRDALYAMAPLSPAPQLEPLPVQGHAVRLPEPLGRISWEPRAHLRDRTFVLQFRRAGLRCARTGRPSADLKTLFQDAGVPAFLRDRVPLLLLDGDLVGVAGVTLCGDALHSLSWTGHPWSDYGWFNELLRSPRGV
jgi:tRNA(Ile)-lysidine synthase